MRFLIIFTASLCASMLAHLLVPHRYDIARWIKDHGAATRNAAYMRNLASFHGEHDWGDEEETLQAEGERFTSWIGLYQEPGRRS